MIAFCSNVSRANTTTVNGICSKTNAVTMMNNIRATLVLHSTAIEFSRFSTFCWYRSNCKWGEYNNNVKQEQQNKRTRKYHCWQRRINHRLTLTVYRKQVIDMAEKHKNKPQFYRACQTLCCKEQLQDRAIYLLLWSSAAYAHSYRDAQPHIDTAGSGRHAASKNSR